MFKQQVSLEVHNESGGLCVATADSLCTCRDMEDLAGDSLEATHTNLAHIQHVYIHLSHT